MTAVGHSVRGYGTSIEDEAVVATALLRRAAQQGEAILLLSQTPAAATAVPNLRSLLESFGELHYLLDGETRAEKAALARLYALRELRDYLTKWPTSAEDLRRATAEFEQKSEDDPAAAAAALAARQYWTPKKRAALVEDAMAAALQAAGSGVTADQGTQLYKLLSWDEHHVMATILAIDLDPDSPTRGQVTEQEVPENPDSFLPFLAAAVLAAMHDEFEAAFPAPSAT